MVDFCLGFADILYVEKSSQFRGTPVNFLVEIVARETLCKSDQIFPPKKKDLIWGSISTISHVKLTEQIVSDKVNVQI